MSQIRLVFKPSIGNLSGMITHLIQRGRKEFVQFNATEHTEYFTLDRIWDRDSGTHYGSKVSSTFGQFVSVTFSKTPVVVSHYTLLSQTGDNCYPYCYPYLGFCFF